MAKYFIKDTTLTSIADAIREKAGITNTLFPENMPSYIRSISTASDSTEGIDVGVVEEANRVTTSILNKIKPNSITFIAISDMHEMGDSDNTSSIVESYRKSNKHAGQGAKLIAQKINPNFFANLGDYSWGAETQTFVTSPYDFFKSIDNAKSYIFDITKSFTSFTVPGNHDVMFDWVDEYSSFVTDDYVAATIGNYKYIDFNSQKVRVIALNTAERLNASASKANMSDEQLAWFASSLDLSAKSDASNWKIIILGHHPIGIKYLPQAAKILEAYVNGAQITVNSISYNYYGKNTAKVIANFHGHTHCFKVANIDATVEINVKRIAIPNACQGRNNEYGRDGDLVYGETKTCPNGNDRKSTIAGQDTAFCVITIDLDKEVIYADCFGSLGDTEPGSHAGYDRVISYAEEGIITYTITNNLTNVTTNNTIGTLVAGSNYTATLTPDTGYSLDTIIVTMDGTDITSTAVNGNNIAISNITGDIVITANAIKTTAYTITYDLANVASSNSATQIVGNKSYSTELTANEGYSIKFVRIFMNDVDVTSTVYSNGFINIADVTGNIEIIAGYYTNLVSASEELSSTAVYNGTGYKNKTYVSGTSPFDGTSAYAVATGWIPIDENNTKPFYVKGVTLDLTQNHVRMHLYSAKNDPEIQSSATNTNAINNFTHFFAIETLGTNYYKLTPIVDETGVPLYTALVGSTLQYIRFSFVGTGDKFIITNDEPISTAGAITTYSVTNNLSNITTNNTNLSVNEGTTYSAILTANSGYTINSVSVSMGGVDITSSVYDNGNINISNVTGNIIITATASQNIQTTYTNLVPTSQEQNSAAVYNGIGYKNGVYASENGDGTDTSCVATGWIPYTWSPSNTIYVRGATITTASHVRFYGWTTKTQVHGSCYATGANGLSNYFTVEEIESGTYYKLTPIRTINEVQYLRVSLIGTGENLIITVNEPIE